MSSTRTNLLSGLKVQSATFIVVESLIRQCLTPVESCVTVSK